LRGLLSAKHHGRSSAGEGDKGGRENRARVCLCHDGTPLVIAGHKRAGAVGDNVQYLLMTRRRRGQRQVSTAASHEGPRAHSSHAQESRTAAALPSAAVAAIAVAQRPVATRSVPGHGQTRGRLGRSAINDMRACAMANLGEVVTVYPRPNSPGPCQARILKRVENH
jgi:hypothetical protein